MLAVGAGIVSLDILKLSVLSFSSQNSERWLDMEYSSDLMGRKLAGTEPLYSSTGNYNRKPNCKQFGYIFILVSYHKHTQTDGWANIQLETLSVVPALLYIGTLNIHSREIEILHFFNVK